jgi:hypothetical protein
MKDFSNIETWTPKKIRQLKMNLNNRVESFKNSEIIKNISNKKFDMKSIIDV